MGLCAIVCKRRSHWPLQEPGREQETAYATPSLARIPLLCSVQSTDSETLVVSVYVALPRLQTVNARTRLSCLAPNPKC